MSLVFPIGYRPHGINAIERRLDDPNLVDKIVEELERTRGVPTPSGSLSDSQASSESIPVPTLRQLVLMAEAKRQHDWNVASTIMALVAEMNRDRKRRRKPFKPDDFNPYAEQRSVLAKCTVEQVAGVLNAIFTKKPQASPPQV